MTPASLHPFSYLLRGSVRKIEKRRTPIYTYVSAKYVAISLKISASLVEMSSNPGVSIRITALSSTVNSTVGCTSVVHNSKSFPTCRFEPLARLINWSQLGELLVIITGHTLLTVDFPLPVAPMTLMQQLE